LIERTIDVGREALGDFVLPSCALLEQRVFGNTGRKVTVLALGGCGPGFVPQEEANKAVQMAMVHGVNIIDVAPSYAEAEIRLRPILEKHRDKFFLAEKTMERTREGARRELESSLRRLGVKSFDLYQMHAVKDAEELEKIVGKGGAIETFEEARETGLTKYIGLTGHEDVRVHMKALEIFEFDSLQLPVNAASLAFPSPVNDFRPVLKMAVDRGVGIIAIKAISRGRWASSESKNYNTWYEPTVRQKEVEMLVRFTLSQEGVTTYSIPCDVRLWPMVLNAGEKYGKLSEEEQREAIEYVRKAGHRPLFPEE